MAFVVAAPCHDCKYTDCVVVCPCECFYQDEHMLYINPDDCIDCGACVPECPVESIFSEDKIPDIWKEYIPLNAVRSRALKQVEGAHILERQDPLEGPGCKNK